jgi:hypothetical protein
MRIGESVTTYGDALCEQAIVRGGQSLGRSFKGICAQKGCIGLDALAGGP